MIVKPLYTGDGKTLSTRKKPGMRLTDYSRLIADSGMSITNGQRILFVTDVLNADIVLWGNCETPIDVESEE